jgi:probable addiction module antidote protein
MAQITDWDAAEHLRDEADISAYLEAVFEDGDPRVIVAALNDAAHARKLLSAAANEPAHIAAQHSSVADPDPRLSTVAELVNALGYRLSLLPVHG